MGFTSLLLIIASYGLFRYILSGHLGISTQVVVISLTLFDLAAFDWTARSVVEVTKGGFRHIDDHLSLRGVADFLKTRKGQAVPEVSGRESPAFDPSRTAIVDLEIEGLEPAGVGFEISTY